MAARCLKVGVQRRTGDPRCRRDRHSRLRPASDQPGHRLHPGRHPRRPAGLGALTGAHPWLNSCSISDPHAIEPFAELGIILLLFSSGSSCQLPPAAGDATSWCSASAPLNCSCALLIGGGLIVRREPAGVASALGWPSRCPRPRWCCRFRDVEPGRTLRRSPCCCSKTWRWSRCSSRSERSAPQRQRDRRDCAARHARCRRDPLAMLVRRPAASAAPVRPGGADQEPGAVPAACLLVVILASLVDGAVGLSPDPRRADRRHCDRRDRLSRRGRGDHRAVRRPRPRHLPDHRRDGIDLRIVLADWQGLLGAPVAVLIIKAAITSLLVRLSGARRPSLLRPGCSWPSRRKPADHPRAAPRGPAGPRDIAAYWQIVTASAMR